MSNVADIQTALFTRLNSLVLVPALPISWPNVDFPPVTSGYLQVNTLTAPTIRHFLDDEAPHEWGGIFQVAVMAQKDTGTTKADNIAASILEHFKAGTKLSFGVADLLITKTPSVAPAFADGAFWRLPVSIDYQTFI